MSHSSGQSPSDNLESWDKRQPGWLPYHEGLPRCFGGLTIFSGGGPPYDLGGLQSSPVFLMRGPHGPPGGGI